MIRIRIHGRGGQGGKTAAELLAIVIFKEGSYEKVQAAPTFGPERRGAPVNAFVRISHEDIRERGAILNPDMVIVLDESLALTTNVADGLKEGGLILINSSKNFTAFPTLAKFRLALVDADTIALRYGLGSSRAPIVNTAILGAFFKSSGLATLETLLDIIGKEPKKPEENKNSATEAFNSVKIKKINREE